MVNPQNVYRRVAVGALLVIASVVLAENERSILGNPEPEWTVDQWLNLLLGKNKVDRQDFRGNVVNLFCFQSWCPGYYCCRLPTLQIVMARYMCNDNVAYFAIQTVYKGFV